MPDVDARAFHPTTKVENANDSLWTKLFRTFSAPRPMVHRFLPKLKASRLMLEVGATPEWKHFEVVLAGSTIGDLGLYYYAAKGDTTPVGCVPLHSAHVDVLEEVLMVVTQDKTWFFCAEHGREAADWAEAICASIDRVSEDVLLSNTGVSSRLSSSRRRLSSHASHITLREIQSREPKARVDEFLEIFVRTRAEELGLQAMEGAFAWSCMRSVAWKVWLDVVPIDAPFGHWIPIIQAKRLRYESLRREHELFYDFVNGDQDDDAFIHACETSDDNLLYGIFKDVRRTRGAMDFFRDPSLQCLLIRVLYTYSLAHPEISYNQGMGELLATLVYLLHIEQWPAQANGATITRSLSSLSLTASSGTGSFIAVTPNTSTVERLSESDSDDASYVYVDSFIDIEDDATCTSMDRERFLSATPFSGASPKYSDCCREAAEDIIREVTDPTFLEHDAYLLLEEIMHRMAGSYCPELAKATSFSPIKRPSGSSLLSTLASEKASSPLYDQMNSIHNHLLSRCDPPTARHLSNLGVEPQMFLLRWVRVLMSREFELAQVWHVWDAIFSVTPSDFTFINVLCVAAVREFRDDILAAEDATAVLLCLRDLSDKVAADRLVENARELYDALLIAAAVEAADAAHH